MFQTMLNPRRSAPNHPKNVRTVSRGGATPFSTRSAIFLFSPEPEKLPAPAGAAGPSATSTFLSAATALPTTGSGDGDTSVTTTLIKQVRKGHAFIFAVAFLAGLVDEFVMNLVNGFISKSAADAIRMGRKLHHPSGRSTRKSRKNPSSPRVWLSRRARRRLAKRDLTPVAGNDRLNEYTCGFTITSPETLCFTTAWLGRCVPQRGGGQQSQLSWTLRNIHRGDKG